MKAFGLAALFVAGVATPGFCAGYDELNAAIRAHNLAQRDAAISHFNSALAIGDLTPDQQYIARLDRGDDNAAKGQKDAAIADYSACIGQRAGDNTALLRRANLYLTLGKQDLALQDFDAAIIADPDESSAHLLRAALYEIMGEQEKELADVEAAQLLDPENKSLNFRIGIAKMELGRFDEAAAIFEQLRHDYPAYGWMWLAIASVKAGKAAPANTFDHVHGNPWPDIIVDSFRGKSSEDQVVKEAAGQAGRLCDANFYLGEWRMVHGDSAGGTPFLRNAIQFCPFWQIERFVAIAELRK